jgi:hypothetical protein
MSFFSCEIGVRLCRISGAAHHPTPAANSAAFCAIAFCKWVETGVGPGQAESEPVGGWGGRAAAEGSKLITRWAEGDRCCVRGDCPVSKEARGCKGLHIISRSLTGAFRRPLSS